MTARARVSLSVLRDNNNFAVLTSNRKVIGYGSEVDCTKYAAYKGTQKAFPNAFVQELKPLTKKVTDLVVRKTYVAVARTYSILSKGGDILAHGLSQEQLHKQAPEFSKARKETVSVKAEYGGGCGEYLVVIMLMAVAVYLMFVLLGGGLLNGNIAPHYAIHGYNMLAFFLEHGHVSGPIVDGSNYMLHDFGK